MTRADIVELLKQGLFDQLKGAKETAWLECKACPYLLDSEQQKMEFAKDVSSMANGEGGLFLLGARTIKSQLHQGEEISGVSPYNQDLVDPDRYHQVAEEWIYPRIPGLRITWCPSKADPKKGIFAVEVPGGHAIGPFWFKKSFSTTERR